MRESIPTVVAYLDLAVFDAHGENGGRLVSGCAKCHAGADAEACAVARRANDPVAFGGAAGELSSIMGTDVLDGVILAVEVDNGLRIAFSEGR